MAKRFLRQREVMQRCGLGRTAIYERRKAGTFPAPIHLPSNTAVWLEDEIDAWIEQQVRVSRGNTPQHAPPVA